MDDRALRRDLAELLRGGGAHLTFENATAGLELELLCRRPAGFSHSIWELTEHMRIAQEDILRYTLDMSWQSPPFPAGYWPDPPCEAVSEDAWQASVVAFLADLEEMISLVNDPAVDLTAVIPHGEGRTYLREVLLVADHNAYHLGQIIDLRRALGVWPQK